MVRMAPVERPVHFRMTWRFLGTLIAMICFADAGLAASAQAVTEALTGTAWQLVQFQGANGQILRPDDGSSYTVEFKTDSTVAVQLDCHRGRGTWLSRSTSQLDLGPLALTRATCPRSLLFDQIAKQWTFIRSYK